MKLSKNMKNWLAKAKIEVKHHTIDFDFNRTPARLAQRHVIIGVRKAINNIPYRYIELLVWNEVDMEAMIVVNNEWAIHVWQGGNVALSNRKDEGKDRTFHPSYLMDKEVKVGKFYNACREANKYLKSMLA